MSKTPNKKTPTENKKKVVRRVVKKVAKKQSSLFGKKPKSELLIEVKNRKKMRIANAEQDPNSSSIENKGIKESATFTAAELRKNADNRTRKKGIKLPDGLVVNLKKIPGGRSILKFIRWGPGGSLVMLTATFLDILSTPFANMPGREMNWKKSLQGGIMMLVTSAILASVYIYLIAVPNILGVITGQIKLAGGILSIATFLGGLSLVASSYRLKTERNFRDLFCKKIDHSPAFDNGFAIQLGEVNLSLEDCHTNIGIFGGIGSGKGNSVTSLVSTTCEKLKRPAGSLKVGEELKTPSGTAKIKEIVELGVQKIWEAHTSHKKTKITKEHLWNIRVEGWEGETICETQMVQQIIKAGRQVLVQEENDGRFEWTPLSIKETEEKEECRCFILDDTEHLYIADGIVTHNCLHPDQNVMLWDGSIKKAKDVLPGDRLMGPDGLPRIVRTTNTGYGPLYRIIPAGNKGNPNEPGSSKGKPWICNDVHVMTLKYTNKGGSRPQRKMRDGISTENPLNRKKHYKGLSFVYGKEVTQNKDLAQRYQEILKEKNYIEDVDLNLLLERSGKRNPSQFWKLFRPENELRFLTYPDLSYEGLDATSIKKKKIKLKTFGKEEFYLTGCWIGDGAKTSYTIYNLEGEVIESLRNYVKKHPDCELSEKFSSENSPNLIFACIKPKDRGCSITPAQQMWIECLQTSLKIKKSLSQICRKDPNADKYVPHWAKTADPDLRRELLAGLLDTDGHYQEEGRCFDFIQKRKHITEAVCFMARSLGIGCSEPVESWKAATNGTTGKKELYWRVTLFGAIERIPTRIKYKKVTKQRALTRQDGRGLQGVDTRDTKDPLCHGWTAEPIGEGEYCGFTLSGDGRFLLDDFTVTHNTQAAMNPLLDQFFRQLSLPEPTDAQKTQAEFSWWHKNPLQKCGALILDQKGDFIDFVIYTMLRYKRPLEDLVVIDPTLDLYCFNPLDPIASADDNANMLSQVQKIVSGGGGGKDKFWDEASKDTVRDFLQMLEVIKPKEKIGLDDLARYIREDELSAYLCDRVDEIVTAKYEKGKLTYEELSKYKDTSSRARAQWVENKSDNVKSTLKVTINQLLGDFAADPRLQKVFCRNTNFDFKDVFNKGKVVLFRGTGVSEKTARVICVTLKLAYQTWAKRRNGANAEKYGVNDRRTCLFFVDEYQEFVTADDGRFFGVSRSSKICGVIATQAYSSLQFAMDNEIATNLLRQNIGTWVFLRTTDEKTIQMGEMLAGQIEKEKINKNIQVDGLTETAMNMASGGHQSKSGDMSVSKQYENYIRKDEFLKLATVDGNKSATGPFYSEAIIYHYHDTDTKRASRMYRTRLRHIYDIDTTYNAAFKAGKVAQNTMDLDQLMYDRNATIRTLRRVIPHIQEVWRNQDIEKEILDAEIKAQNNRRKQQEEIEKSTAHLNELRDQLINRIIYDPGQSSSSGIAKIQMEPLRREELSGTNNEDLNNEIENLEELYKEIVNDADIAPWERDSLKTTLEELRMEQQTRETEEAEAHASSLAQAIIRFGTKNELN